MQPFEPKNVLPEWRLIYDNLLETADFGTIVTYAQLDEALGRPFKKSRSPLYRARLHLGEVRQRWVESVKNVGYRIVEASEHMTLAQQRKQRAKRQLRHMVRMAEFTDLARLKPEELTIFDSQSKLNAALYAVVVHHERRLQRIEQILRLEGKL